MKCQRLRSTLQRARIPHPASLLILIVILSSWQSDPPKLKIAVSKATENYVKWLRQGDPAAEIVDMRDVPLAKAPTILGGCSALLLTGGDDIWPGLYGMKEEVNRCEELDRHRDSLEQILLRSALTKKMPVMGICRGLQMINITLGGTLWIDLPADYQLTTGSADTTVHHRCEDYLNCFHGIRTGKESLMSRLTGAEIGFVNTNHHQGVHTLATGLKSGSMSPDGLTESIEWAAPAGKSYLLGVQWHPERMDTSNIFSGRLLNEFYRQAELYQKSKIPVKK